MLTKIPEEVMLKMAYLLKGKTGIAEIDISYALSTASEYICNYCNINKVPKLVYSTWTDMALDILKELFPESFKTDGEGDVEINKVSSVKVGDTTVALGSEQDSKNAEVNAYSDMQNRMISLYKTQLHRVRKINYDGS